MRQIIFVEGLPGTGKTTMIQWLSGELEKRGEAVTLLLEGDEGIPCDFYETAGIPKKDFEQMCADNPEYNSLWKDVLRTENYVFLRIDNRGIVLIDSGFLQNPINELLFRGANSSQVKFFVGEIANFFRPLNPFCIYLKRSGADVAIDFAKKAKGKGWADRIDALLSWHGHANHFEDRFALELELLASDITPYLICDIEDADWLNAKESVKKYYEN